MIIKLNINVREKYYFKTIFVPYYNLIPFHLTHIAIYEPKIEKPKLKPTKIFQAFVSHFKD